FVGLWPPRWQRLPIVAESPARFEEWLRNEAQPARGSTSGAELFASAGCSYCHVVRGEVEDASQLAPDLTHFASRRTIAATNLPNRRGFLDGWVVHSAALKRGSGMPDNRLDPAVLRGVVRYLESLR
ncbi:MAG TPA: c-type cytochrome, partial [Thermoanaerobaculia bacterium]|nr:c-type cytochrome [Thermoanaerobaculia bacterium]